MQRFVFMHRECSLLSISNIKLLIILVLWSILLWGNSVLTPTSFDLYSINDSQVKAVDDELTKSILENNKCYLLDCGDEVFVWVGRVTQVEERKAAIQAAEVLM